MIIRALQYISNYNEVYRIFFSEREGLRMAVGMDGIRMELSRKAKQRPVPGERLGFGQWFSDHMFVMDYEEGKGWHDPRIVPYGPFELDPASMVFHYGQAVFEGMKAFRHRDGSIRLFRPGDNARRMNRSCERMGIPTLDEDLFVEAVRRLVMADAEWVPSHPGSSLYIRPFVFATEPSLGVRMSTRYRFAVILSPVNGYFGDQAELRPIAIHVEDQYVRAVSGGTGEAKTPGNYAAGMIAQTAARQRRCDQVLWLDGVERTYAEEVGNMNVFFRLDDAVVTPALNGSILAGIMRDTAIQLLRKWGIPVEERKVAISELADAADKGRLKEAFGTGTAAVVCPIGRFIWNGTEFVAGQGTTGPVSRRLYEAITGIQTGSIADEFGWTVPV